MSSATETMTDQAKLVIVDDDPEVTSQLGLALRKEFAVKTAGSLEEGWEVIQQVRPELVTLDLALDGVDPETGFSLLEKCLKFDPLLKIVMITGNDEEENALRAIERGAADFLSKPVDLSELKVLLKRTLATGRLERKNNQLLTEIGREKRLGAIVGQSEPMREMFNRIERVAAADIAVLILGESGTGKELVAKEIRRLSARATKPFVTVNCGAIPENLLESELFGHMKGSFTGAYADRPGRLELANTGIVFLDEIGDMPMMLQVKLLRFLQEHEVERVGGRSIINLDVRVLAATSRDLEKEVAEGRFRQDLYYRLSVVNVKLPPLSKRADDILFLAEYFKDRFCIEHSRPKMTLTPEAKQAMLGYGWPGNVRELEYRIQRAVVMSPSKRIQVADLELDSVEPDTHLSLREARDEADRQSIKDALRQTTGNISKAAELLGISRPSLHALLTKYGIQAQEYKSRNVGEWE